MNTAAIPAGFELKEKVAALSELILSKHPRMPTLLREIHSTIRQYPEQVLLLEETEIAQIVNGLKVQTGVEFTQAAISGAKSSSATKNIKNKIATLGLDAI